MIAPFFFHMGSEVGCLPDQYSYEDLVTAAQHVAWQFSIGNPGSYHPPGDMLRCVIDAMVRADRGHMAHLRRAYPLHAALIDGLKHDDPGILPMILNLLKYHPSEGWTDSEPAPALPAAADSPEIT